MAKRRVDEHPAGIFDGLMLEFERKRDKTRASFEQWINDEISTLEYFFLKVVQSLPNPDPNSVNQAWITNGLRRRKERLAYIVEFVKSGPYNYYELKEQADMYRFLGAEEKESAEDIKWIEKDMHSVAARYERVMRLDTYVKSQRV